MLLTDETALKKAKEIIRKSGIKASITRTLWVGAEKPEDDIFCYYVLKEGEEFEYPPGTLLPLFKRNGEATDFLISIPT